MRITSGRAPTQRVKLALDEKRHRGNEDAPTLLSEERFGLRVEVDRGVRGRTVRGIPVGVHARRRLLEDRCLESLEQVAQHLGNAEQPDHGRDEMNADHQSIDAEEKPRLGVDRALEPDGREEKSDPQRDGAYHRLVGA